MQPRTNLLNSLSSIYVILSFLGWTVADLMSNFPTYLSEKYIQVRTFKFRLPVFNY